MDLNFVFILGLCSVIKEFASCFLLPSDSASVADGFEDWGPWTVVQPQPCLRLRTRNCKEVGCKKQDFSYCPDVPVPHWEPWSKLQCTVVTSACIIARTRSCSIPSVKDCQSTENNQDIHVWGDMKTCPCREGTIALPDQDNGQWGEWSGWKCETREDNCYVFRTRECSVHDTKDCPPSGSSQLTLIEDKKCPCETDAITTESVSPLTTPSGDIDSSTNSNVPTWSDWGQWLCHDVDFGCMQHRLRKCSVAGNECQGEHYEMSICDGKNCIDKTANANGTVTGHVSGTKKNATWTEWGQWECHTEQIVPCVLYRYRECNDGNDLDCEKKGGSKYDMSLCSNCSDFSGATSVKPTTLPPATATTSVQESTSASFATSKTLTTYTSFTKTSLTTKSSTKLSSIVTDTPLSNLQTTDALTSTAVVTIASSTTAFTPIYWREWEGWTCQNQSNGCFMYNKRSCSTSNTSDCEHLLTGKSTKVQICNNTICPARWLQWSAWKCKLGFGGSCNMTRTRECSTGINAACGNVSSMSEQCDKHVCPDKVEIQQKNRCNNYSSTDCNDTAPACQQIKDPTTPACKLSIYTSACPRACGCCEEEPYWLSWSKWACHRSHNHTCSMKRTRTCSTANIKDCKGMSEMEAACFDTLCPASHWSEWSSWRCYLEPISTCRMSRTRNCSSGMSNDCVGLSKAVSNCSNTVCPDLVGLKVDCSLHDSKSGCKESDGCAWFKAQPELICKDPTEIPKCPVTCGCCVHGTNVYTSTMVTTKLSTARQFSSTPGSAATTQNSATTDVFGSSTTITTVGQSSSMTDTNGTKLTSAATGSITVTKAATVVQSSSTPGTGGSSQASTAGSSPSAGSSNTIVTTPATAVPSSSTPDAGGTSQTSVTTVTPVSGGSSTIISKQTVHGQSSPMTVTSGTPQTLSTVSVSSSTVDSSTLVTKTTASGQSSSTTNAGSTPQTSTVTVSSAAVDSSTIEPKSTTGGQSSSTTSAGGTPQTSTVTVSSAAVDSSTIEPKSTTGRQSSSTTSADGTPQTSTVTVSSAAVDSSTIEPKSTTGGQSSSTTNAGSTPQTSTVTVSSAAVDSSTIEPKSTTGGQSSSTTSAGGTPQTSTVTGTSASDGSSTVVITKPATVLTSSGTAGAGGTSQNSTASGSTIEVDTSTILTTSSSGRPDVTSSSTAVTPVSTISTKVNSTTNTGGIPQNLTNTGGSGNVGTSSITTNTPSTIVTANNTNVTGATSQSSTITSGASTVGSSIITTTSTTTPAPVKTTTHKQPYTNPSSSLTCKACAGPEFLCEQLYADKKCDSPDNYCINKLKNNKDGSRSVIRGCGSFDTCYNDWFLGSSDSDKCRNYEDNNIITLDFECTFCCIEDGCNQPIRPKFSSLYKDL